MELPLESSIKGLSNTSGQDYFKATVLNLQKTINSDFCFIARIDPHASTVRTVAFAHHNQVIDNRFFDLADTPCATVTQNNTCCFPEGVTDLYPKDQFLADMGINGYMGTPLKDAAGNVFGLVVALFHQQIPAPDLVTTLFELFSDRISAEIEREEQQIELNRINRQLEGRVEETAATLDLTQEELFRRDKLASMARVIAGVAHEINTPLGAAMLANSVNSEMLDTLEKKYNNNELSRTDLENIMTDARESVDLISRNLQRAADLVQNFKRFSVDRPAPIFEKLRLQDSVKSLIVSLNPEYQKSDIKVHYKLDPELSIVTNPPYLFQALNSVLMNIPAHAFRVHDVTQERTVEILANLDSSDSLKLEIKDNGRGMDQETLKNAFEPFFTTARSDGRIGFGLHHAYTIITRFLYGQISLQSAPGSGTCVLITLPLNGNMVSGQ